MRLNLLYTESDVTAARGDILNTVNDLATQIAQQVGPKAGGGLGFPPPQVDTTTDPSNPALVYIEAGRNVIEPSPQTITVTIYSDDDISIEMPALLTRRLNVHDYYHLRTLADVVKALTKVRTAMRMQLGGQTNVV
jgi:hypothetical protein